MATTAKWSFELDPLKQPTRGNQEMTAATDNREQGAGFSATAKRAEAPVNKLHSLVFQDKGRTDRAEVVSEVDKHIVLIDVENVQPTDLGALAGQDTRVFLFLGQTQTRLPLGLVQALQPLGSAVTFVHGKAGTRNSMDSIMAFYLGRLSVELPDAHFTIMSKDTGFDPLVNYMKEAGVQCRRVADTLSADQPSRGNAGGHPSAGSN